MRRKNLEISESIVPPIEPIADSNASEGAPSAAETKPKTRRVPKAAKAGAVETPAEGEPIGIGRLDSELGSKGPSSDKPKARKKAKAAEPVVSKTEVVPTGLTMDLAPGDDAELTEAKEREENESPAIVESAPEEVSDDLATQIDEPAIVLVEAPKEAKPRRGRAKAKVVEPETPAEQIPEPDAVEPVAVEPVAIEEVKAKPRSRRGAKAVKAEEPITAATPEEPSEFAIAGLELSWRPRSTAAATAAPAAPVATEVQVEAAKPSEPRPFDPGFLDDLIAQYPNDSFPMPSWRIPAGGATAKAVSEESEHRKDSEDEEEQKQGGRRDRSRRRRGRDKRDSGKTVELEASDDDGDDDEEEANEPTVAAKPAAVATKPKEAKPVEVGKPILPIPDAAPQVVNRNGLPTLVRKGRVYPPLFFFGSMPDERRATTVLEEIKLAAESGIHLHSLYLELEVSQQSVSQTIAAATQMLKRVVEVDPEAQILFRVDFRAPYGWAERYTKARYRTREGNLAEPSVCDDEFWGDARKCLESLVAGLRSNSLTDHILGVHLERGEWFFSQGSGYDESEAAKIQFRAWARTRYVNDEVMLRASWFDGGARFDTITPPEYQPEGTEGERFVRSSRKQRKYVDYHLFLSDTTVARLADLAYAAKKASEGYFLVGVSYGYTFEWSHPSNGHLSLGKLLRSPEIDFVAGPPSYKSREPGGTGAFPGPIDSFALNGKLFLSEEDFKTTLGGNIEPDDFNPAIKTPQDLESLHWRGAGAALAHGTGSVWMDMWGSGWLKTHSVWERAAKVRDAFIKRMAAPVTDPDVTIFVDERALAYLVDPNAFTLLVQNVREAVMRAGVSAGFYLLSDLAHREKFPESKVYLFLNAWDIRPELRTAIKTRLQRDGKILFWLYSAGLFDAGRDSLERAREVTGIALKPQPFNSKSGTTIFKSRHSLSEAFPDRNALAGSKLEPSYFAIPEDATVLGEYSQTGLPSFVVRDFQEGNDKSTRWTSIFLGEPQVNPALIRALVQMAGAHVWNFQDDVVHVRAPFLTVHCQVAGARTIALPDKHCAYNLLTGQWAAVDSVNLRFHANAGSTHSFLVGTHEEVQNLIQVNPADWLKMDQLPPREANIRQDASNFDVPIMRLGEWIEGGESDDVADEWFLRPIVVEVPEGEDENPPLTGNSGGRDNDRRRGRRRRGGRDGVGSDEITTSRREPSGTPVEVEDFSMNVLFRKRD